MRRSTLTAALAALLVVLAPTAAAQYPSKPIRIIVMYGPGSTIDIMARLTAPKFTDIRVRLVQLGTEPTTSTPEQSTAVVRYELAKWGKVIKAAGIKTE